MSSYKTAKTTLLKDNSWIRKPDDEDELVDQDPNFAKTVLTQRKSNETLASSEPEVEKNPKPISTSTSVQELSKRFGGSQNDLRTNTLPPTKSSYTKSTYSSVKSDSPTITTTTKTTVTETPKTSTKTTTVTKDGKTTETTITTTESVRSPVTKTPTETFSERVKSSSKGQTNPTYSPTKTTKVTEKTVTTTKDVEDKLYDTLKPSPVKDYLSPTDSKTTVSSTETVTLKSSTDTNAEDQPYDRFLPSSIKGVAMDSDVFKTKTTTKTSSTAESKQYDVLLPSSIRSDSTSPVSTTVTKRETVTVKSSKAAEDQPYDRFLPSSIKGVAMDSKPAVFTTETVTVKSSSNDDVFKTKTTTKTSSTAEDKLYDVLLPSSIRSDSTSPVSTTVTKRETVTVKSSKAGESPTLTSPSFTQNLSSYSSYSNDAPSSRTSSYTVTTSDDYISDRNTYTYTRPDSSYEYSSIKSPTVYTTSSYTRSSSRSDDILADPIYSKSSLKNVYASPERTVLEKDLCTICRRPFTGDAKMVLDDMKIKCHASCFKCDVCNITLGDLRAGDSLWIYKRMVHCENCFETTKAKWQR